MDYRILGDLNWLQSVLKKFVHSSIVSFGKQWKYLSWLKTFYNIVYKKTHGILQFLSSNWFSGRGISAHRLWTTNMVGFRFVTDFEIYPWVLIG